MHPAPRPRYRILLEQFVEFLKNNPDHSHAGPYTLRSTVRVISSYTLKMETACVYIFENDNNKRTRKDLVPW